MASGKAFGVNRVFNGKPAPQPHMGTDYLTPAGTPVIAAADGMVALAQDLFHPGNAVFVDHGDGLITMSFHLSEIAVQAGQAVKKGELLGKVGTTGRSTARTASLFRRPLAQRADRPEVGARRSGEDPVSALIGSRRLSLFFSSRKNRGACRRADPVRAGREHRSRHRSAIGCRPMP